jgi:hypothetical protein
MIMQHAATTAIGLRDLPLFKRLASKLVVDVLPAAFVSVLGGFIVTQYQFNRAPALHAATEQVVPASAEMMQLVRDEHAAIIDYLKVQMAEEKSRHAAEDAADAKARARAVAEVPAEAAAAAPEAPVESVALPPAPLSRPLAASAAKPMPRTRAVATTASVPPHAPLVIAQADQAVAAAPADQPSVPKSLLTRTLEIKDHVVGATLHAVSAIGSIPSWIAGMGDRIGGPDATSSPAARQFTTSS